MSEGSSSDALPIVLIGAGGHAQVLLSLLRQVGRHVLGVCDPHLVRSGQALWQDLPVLGDDSYFTGAPPGKFGLVNGIGLVPGKPQRAHVQAAMDRTGHLQPVLLHPRAFVDPSVRLDPGTQIMAGAVIQLGVRLGRGVLVNTCASVDHHSDVGDGVHIAPGATICGNASIGRGAFIGAGAVVAPDCSVGEMSIVAAGTSVVRDVASGMMVRGPQPKLYDRRNIEADPGRPNRN